MIVCIQVTNVFDVNIRLIKQVRLKRTHTCLINKSNKTNEFFFLLCLDSSSMSETSGSRNRMMLRKKTKDSTSKERKGWSITIHDLSGSPVAVASMVTPFVASPGSDRVSRGNPGAWLILRPGEGTWKPWAASKPGARRATPSDTNSTSCPNSRPPPQPLWPATQ